MNILIYIVILSIYSRKIFTFNFENKIDEWVLKIDGDQGFVEEFGKSNDLTLIGNVNKMNLILELFSLKLIF